MSNIFEPPSEYEIDESHNGRLDREKDESLSNFFKRIEAFSAALDEGDSPREAKEKADEAVKSKDIVNTLAVPSQKKRPIGEITESQEDSREISNGPKLRKDLMTQTKEATARALKARDENEAIKRELERKRAEEESLRGALNRAEVQLEAARQDLEATKDMLQKEKEELARMHVVN